jgi:hypothetical protein
MICDSHHVVLVEVTALGLAIRANTRRLRGGRLTGGWTLADDFRIGHHPTRTCPRRRVWPPVLKVYSLGLMGVLTPYASGPAPIWYSSGYIPTKDFWRLGAMMGALYLAVLLVVGLPFAINFLH